MVEFIVGHLVRPEGKDEVMTLNRWKTATHLAIGVALIPAGVWIANGNLLSVGGFVAALGCLCIFIELPGAVTHSPADGG